MNFITRAFKWDSRALGFLMTLFVSQMFLTQSQDGGDWVMESLKLPGSKIDKEWSDYVDDLAGDYEETTNESSTTTEELTTPKPEYREWSRTVSGEAPFLAVIYARDFGASTTYKEKFPNETDPGASHIEPGTACGGALLTPSHVLTVCGCVSHAVVSVTGIPPLFSDDDPTNQTYLILSPESPGTTPQLYVTYSVLQFKPNFKHRIDYNSQKWTTRQDLNCVKLIDEARSSEGSTKAERANSELVLLPFTPEVTITFPGMFAKWPPFPINDNTDKSYKELVEVVSIGMYWSGFEQFRFFSSITPSTLKLKHCNNQTAVCDSTKVPRTGKTTCFCPRVQGHQLSGGVIGWPIVRKRALVGLTTSERDSKDGSVSAAVLDTGYVSAIESYVGKKTLEKLSKEDSVFRAKDLSPDFNLYDYGAVAPHRPGAASSATKLYPLIFITSLPFFSRLFIAQKN